MDENAATPLLSKNMLHPNSVAMLPSILNQITPFKCDKTFGQTSAYMADRHSSKLCLYAVIDVISFSRPRPRYALVAVDGLG